MIHSVVRTAAKRDGPVLPLDCGLHVLVHPRAVATCHKPAGRWLVDTACSELRAGEVDFPLINRATDPSNTTRPPGVNLRIRRLWLIA